MSAHRQKNNDKNTSFGVTVTFFFATSDHDFRKAVRNRPNTRRKSNLGQREERPIMPQPRNLPRITNAVAVSIRSLYPCLTSHISVYSSIRRLTQNPSLCYPTLRS